MASSSGHQPNFAALNRGRHLCSAERPSGWALAHILVCTGYSSPVISTGRASVDIGASANLEVVDKFCYLGDMLSVDGDADAAVEARI